MKSFQRTLNRIRRTYPLCPGCDRPTHNLFLCNTCDHIHCDHCNYKFEALPPKMARKARTKMNIRTNW